MEHNNQRQLDEVYDYEFTECFCLELTDACNQFLRSRGISTMHEANELKPTENSFMNH